MHGDGHRRKCDTDTASYSETESGHHHAASNEPSHQRVRELADVEGLYD